MERIIEYLGYGIQILAVLGVTIEIIPIKFSPLKWIGKRVNSDINKKINKIEEDLSDLRKTTDMNDIGALRSRICNFNNLCRLDTNHDQIEKHQYTVAFHDIDKWNEYHAKYKNLNGELKVAIENIEESYKMAKFDK